MEAKKHPEYDAEEQHLQETIQWAREEKAFLKDYEEILRSEIVQLKKTINTLMDERLVAKQQLYNIASRDVGNLQKAEENPYFGRIDFQENRRDEIEKIYIGKHGLMDRDKEIPIVVDWRAPIADIYYSGHSKEVSYRAPDGEIKGSMYLKRRYDIQDGELVEIFDDKTSEDVIEDSLKNRGTFLTEALNKSTQGRLKEIVATIQDQQNKIIRSEMIKPLVVQGVAGSGKTTIALHRMAYLIYNNRRNIENSNYMVIAPNKLFLNYISDILPDLGVENVVQTTFEDWAHRLLEMKIQIGQKEDKLNQLMDKRNPHKEIIALGSKIKGSLLFKKVIDHSIKILEKNLLPKRALQMEDVLIISYEKMQEIFMTSNVHLSVAQRVKKMREYLKGRMKKDIHEIKEKIEEVYKNRIDELKGRVSDLEPIRKEIIALYDERDRKIQGVQNNLSGAVDRYMDEVKLPSILEFYIEIFQHAGEMEKAFKNKIGEQQFSWICQEARKSLTEGIYENEDLGPLAYLHIKLFGLEERNKYAHIVVDEAQDLDEFKMSILRELSMNDSFTFVGDLSQGIYGYRSINNWEKTMERVFKDKEYNYHLLTTSYRSTIEIVELANGVIEKCKGLNPVLAEPIFRHGPVPMLAKFTAEEPMYDYVAKGIKELEKEGFFSAAIICKDLEQTKKVYGVLKNRGEQLQLITDEISDYQGGTVVIPAYLSKGLEFDAVMIWDTNQENYGEGEIDIKLLYIAITRALHRVYMLCQGTPSLLLQGLHPPYQLEHQG